MSKGVVERYPVLTEKQLPAGKKEIHFSNGQTIELAYVPTNYGMRRYLFCPSCGCRRMKLYLKNNWMACRQCHDLIYQSSKYNHDRYAVVLMRAHRAAWQLGVEVKPPYFHEGVQKPRSMRWATFSSLMQELQWCSTRWAEVWLADVARSGLLKS